MKKQICSLFLLFLISCCDLKEGKIISKTLIPPYEYDYETIQHIGKSLIPIHHSGVTDSEYVFIIFKEGYKNEISVDKKIFDLYKIGDYFNEDSIKNK